MKLDFFDSSTPQTPTTGAPQPSPITGAPQSSNGVFGLQSILGPVQIGRDYSGNFAFSIRGLAVRRTDGTYVALDGDGDALIDVTPLILAGVDPCVVRLPVPRKKIKPGDLIIVSDNPFTCFYVLDKEGREGFERIIGLDPIAGQIVRSVPQRNLFLNFLVQAVSLFNLLTPGRYKGGKDSSSGSPQATPEAREEIFEEEPKPGKRRPGGAGADD